MFPSAMKAVLLASSCWLATATPGTAQAFVQSENRVRDSLTPDQAVSCQIKLDPNTSDIANTSYVQWVKSATLPSGTTYRYVFATPFEPEKPYLLFLHGFPESSYSWVNQIDYFIRQGYGIIAPDLLGTGGTDNPSDLQQFRLKTIVEQVGELLDCEGVKQVIGVAHDFGAPLLSRIHTYQPNRLSALAFLGLGYFGPGVDLNAATIYAVNNASEAGRGYAVYGYFLFQNRDDAASIYNAHLDSVYTLAFADNSTYFRTDFAPVGAMERWLQEDRQLPIGNEYVSKVTQEQWKTIVRAQGGLDGPLKWYKSMMRGVNTPDERENLERPAAIEQPVLLLLADQDAVGIPSLQANSTVPYAANLQIRSVDAGHFLQTMKAREVNLHLELFLKSIRNGTAS